MNVWRTIRSDYLAAKRSDPSIGAGLRGFFEVLICTPGFFAITMHRALHFMHSTLHIPVLPRFLSLVVRWWTGIEIHPAARIGAGFFVDHGAGVVIGETAEIGENVTLFHGVTLGATGNEKTYKRHPTLGDNIFVGSGAKILGPIKIGSNAKIGANSVVLSDVPEGATIAGVRAKVVKVNGVPVSRQDEGARVAELEARIALLEEELRRMRMERVGAPAYLSRYANAQRSGKRGASASKLIVNEPNHSTLIPSLRT